MDNISTECSFPMRILVLDDSTFDRSRLKRMIQSAHLKCEIVEIDLLAKLEGILIYEEFSVAILDYDLPDGTGIEAQQIIVSCKENSKLSSIMITGNDTPDVKNLALRNGCSSFFLKSGLTPGVLSEAIVRAAKCHGSPSAIC